MKILGAILKTLRSLKFTVFLIICLAVIFLLGVIIPQKNLLGKDIYLQWKQRNPDLISFLEFIKFTEIYISPITIALWSLFFLNLAFIMSNRIPFIWRKCFRESLPSNVDAVKNSRRFEIINCIDINNIKTALVKNGYKVFDKDNAFWAVKNRFSPLATILFHLSFFLLLSGGVISFYTQFKGEVDLAVGESFAGQYSWIKKPKIGDIPSTKLIVEEVKPTYYLKTVPVSLDVLIQTKNGRKAIGINRPYKEGGLSFVIKNIDIAPLLVLTDAEGKEIDGAYVKLKGLGGNEDNFLMKGYEFRTVFFTDYYAKALNNTDETANLPQALKQTPMTQEVTVQPKEVVNPAFDMAVLKDGKLLNKKTIKIGEAIDFNGHRLAFSGLTYWVRFYVVKEYGIWVIYAGFTLMLFALTIRFLFFRRDISGIVHGDSLYVGGKGDFFPALFDDEFRRIAHGSSK